MGMRASIAMTGIDGLTRITSVQWSTRLDQTIGNYLAQRGTQGDELSVALSELLEAVIKHGHISALEILESAEEGYKAVPLGYGTFISFPQEKGVKPAKMSRQEVREYHLDYGSIGAHYDQRHPERIEFFWYDDATGVVTHRNVSLAELVRFYAPEKLSNNRLKSFGNLRKR